MKSQEQERSSAEVNEKRRAALKRLLTERFKNSDAAQLQERRRRLEVAYETVRSEFNKVPGFERVRQALLNLTREKPSASSILLPKLTTVARRTDLSPTAPAQIFRMPFDTYSDVQSTNSDPPSQFTLGPIVFGGDPESGFAGQIEAAIEPGVGGGGRTILSAALLGTYRPSPSTSHFVFSSTFSYAWGVEYQSYLWREAAAGIEVGVNGYVWDQSGNPIGKGESWQVLVNIDDHSFSEGPNNLSGGNNLTMVNQVDVDPGKVPDTLTCGLFVTAWADAQPANPTGASHVRNGFQFFSSEMDVWEN